LHFKYLLKRAEVNRSTEPPAIFVVNEHEGKSDAARKNEQARYRRFFLNKNQIKWTDLSFERFSENPAAILGD
jgi:hypothetical protein